MNPNPPEPPPLNFEALVGDAVAEILTHEDSTRFLDWMQHHLGDYLSDDFQAADDDLGRLAAGLGRALWNSTPLPSDGFRPRPLPQPGRNDPCYCGSGRKYKRCCASEDAGPEISGAEMLPVVLAYMVERSPEKLAEARNLPVEGLIMLADKALDEGRYAEGVRYLEPLFADPVRRTDETYEYALTLLLNLYDELGHNRKKTALLQRIIDTMPRSPLRSGAWQRLATIRIDQGETDGAWQAFRQAQQDDPEAPALSALEVQLLMARGEAEQARERARFWIRRLERQGFDPDEPPITFLAAVADNPVGTMMDVGLSLHDNMGTGLMEWLETVRERPLPRYQVAAPGDDESVDDSEGLASHLRGMGVPQADIDDILADLEADDEEEAPAPTENSLCLYPPAAIADVEKQWRDVFPAGKPFSVMDTAPDGADAWNMEHEVAWTMFLQDHPEAFDSVDIIDDLATAVQLHPQAETMWTDQALLEPLVRRAADILALALEGEIDPWLPWIDPFNRPALRSLARLTAIQLRAGNTGEVLRLAEWLLSINPADNHGFRTVLANERLRRGDDDAMLALAEAYPGDGNPEIVYGKVLALYRLDRLAEAEQALADAVEYLPKVVRHLTHKRVAKPKLSEFGIQFGGDDQAWLYRDAMRDVWLATPGAIEWLKRTAKRYR